MLYSVNHMLSFELFVFVILVFPKISGHCLIFQFSTLFFGNVLYSILSGGSISFCLKCDACKFHD